MAENSNIEWTDHTFNAWWGCDRVSPACDDCYAAAWAHRLGMDNLWLGDRRFFGEAHWREPLKWARKANGTRPRVFTNSMADVFDNHEDVGPARWRLWNLIRKTPELDWLLLTKRIGNARRMLPEDWGRGYPNVWLGITVVNQEEADRDIPKLLEVPAAVRFLSCEPLLGPISFEGCWVAHPNPFIHENWLEALDWVIVGGESGKKARPMHPQWAYDLRDQCVAVGTGFFFKQWGEWKHMGYSSGPAGPDDEKGVILEAEDPRWMPYMWKVGKKRAGRVLNNRTWDELPRSHVSK
jgi:protein gp37